MKSANLNRMLKQLYATATILDWFPGFLNISGELSWFSAGSLPWQSCSPPEVVGWTTRRVARRRLRCWPRQDDQRAQSKLVGKPLAALDRGLGL